MVFLRFFVVLIYTRLISIISNVNGQALIYTSGIKTGTYSIPSKTFRTCQSSGFDYYNPVSLSCKVSIDNWSGKRFRLVLSHNISNAAHMCIGCLLAIIRLVEQIRRETPQRLTERAITFSANVLMVSSRLLMTVQT